MYNRYTPFQNKTATGEKTEPKMSACEIFEKVLDRKKTATELHHKFMMIFAYLNMKGFKKMQEYRFLDETDELFDLEKHYMKKHGKLYCPKDENLDVNPYSIMQMEDRLAIPVEKKRAIIKWCFDEWKKWECETKDCLEDYICLLEEEGHIDDVHELEEELHDVDKEIKHLEKYLIKFNDVDWCIKYLYDKQHYIKEKYKEKIEELFD